jgi:ribonuclease M5
LKIKEAIIVEGIYDKVKLEQLIDAVIIPTNGFAVFNDRNLKEMIRKLALKKGIIIFTDSDRAGFLIRRYIQSFIPASHIKHAYIPEIYGKERRKDKPGREGLLGVEGMSKEIIIQALKNAECDIVKNMTNDKVITKQDLYRDGISGKNNSRQLRMELLKELQLPSRLSANALLDVLNALFTYEEYQEFISNFLQNMN